MFDSFSSESQKIFFSNSIKREDKVEYSEIEQKLLSEGYSVLDVVKDFFTLCAYRYIRFPIDLDKNIYKELIVNPIEDADSADRLDLIEAFNLDLCPIAYLDWGANVFIDKNERLYLFEDCELYKFGNDLISGIEEIFKGKNGMLHIKFRKKPIPKR